MRPYSEDLRERAVQRVEAGETIREIAAALRIIPTPVARDSHMGFPDAAAL